MIKSTQAKYIKLGGKSAYEEKSFNEGILLLGYHEIKDQYCIDRETLINECKNQPSLKSKATDHARQIYDFYHAPEDTIWITFANGYMYWCQAAKDIHIISYDDQGEGKYGSRYRKTINGWSNKDINGKILRISDLNGNLTKVAAYRGTICNVQDDLFDYLLRRINGEDLPEVIKAKENKKNITESIKELFKFLHWKDFELLVELVFAQSGWQRLSSSGGTQKTIDIEIIAPNGEPDARLRVIYDNGTESNLLRRSLQRALFKDSYGNKGRRITDPEAGPLFSDELEESDTESGTIYVLRSNSEDPYIKENRDVIHKIGVTGGDLKRRFNNVKNDPTFLMADVEVVALYKLSNINRAKLEKLIHKFFESAKLNIDIKDRFGKLITPREWFLVPLFVIDEAVEKIKEGTIVEHRYDSANGRIYK